MRFLHTADLHLGKTLEGRNRAVEQERVLAEICELAERHQVDLVLMAGDIYDGFNPSAEAERQLYGFLRRLSSDGSRAVVLIAGNHDQPQRLAAALPLAQEHGIYIVGMPGQLPPVDGQAAPGRARLIEAEGHVLRFRLPHVAERVAVLALPYCSEARLQEVYLRDLADEAALAADYQQRLAALLHEAAAELVERDINLCMAHLFLCGGGVSDSERPLAGMLNVGGSYGVSSSVFPPLLQYVALGHLHRPQQISGALPCVYAGSPLAYSFSEAGQAKNVVLGEVYAGQPAAYQRLPLKSGYPLSVWRAENYTEALSWCEDEKRHDMWVNLEITLSEPLSSEQLTALREAHPRLLSVRGLLPEAEISREPAEDLGIAERFSLFVAQNTGAAAEQALVEMFMELLAQGEEEAL